MQNPDDIDKESIYAFLDALKEHGSINMFAAPVALQEQFGYDKYTCKQLFFDWMKYHETKSRD